MRLVRKYTKKFPLFVLLVGLISLTTSCKQQTPSLTLEAFRRLSFPSASALAFSNNKLVVLGDDAPYLLLLDASYRLVDSLHFVTASQPRLSKDEKPDIEAATLLPNGMVHAFGSHSGAKRRVALEINPETKRVAWQDATAILGRLPQNLELNIEGACFVNGQFVLGNRGHEASRVNHLLIQRKDSFHTAKISFSAGSRFVGLSGLEYVAAHDLLLFTASEEETASTTEDGVIGDSYLGVVKNFSKKLSAAKITADALLPLTTFDKRFAGQKIESVCVQEDDGSSLLLHLAADNDKGNSYLFKVRLQGFD